VPGPYIGPEYERLLGAARRSLERTGGDLTGTVSVKNPDDAKRKAIIGITGQYRPEGTGQITVRLADLDRHAREATGHGLPDLLEHLGPPLRNLGIRADDDYVALAGAAQATPWDPALAGAMTATGRVVYEESVADALIADLSGW
jgi:hypothetical protein